MIDKLDVGKKIPRVGVISINEVTHRGASTANYIWNALDAIGVASHLGTEQSIRPIIGSSRKNLKKRIVRKLFFARAAWKRRKYARAVESDLRDREFDVLVGVYATLELDQMCLPESVPLVLVSDATVSLCMNHEHPNYAQRLASERRAHERASLVLYPSHWAAQRARADYPFAAQRIHVVPWGGANELSDVRQSTGPHGDGPIELLFIGFDTKRKGLPLAIEAVQSLRSAGHDVRLTTIGGCAAGSPEPGVTHLGRLNLKVEHERALFESAYSKSSCLVHPAKFECYGHVLVEACARGLPVICTEVGGMPTIIEHEVNGLLLPNPPTVCAIEKAVCRLIDDPPLRIQLASNARSEWETRLSWACWSRTFLQLLD